MSKKDNVVVKAKGIVVDIRTDVSVYITIKGLTYYVENSEDCPNHVGVWSVKNKPYPQLDVEQL